MFTCICICANCAYKPSFIQFTATKRRKSLWLLFVSCHSLAQCFVSLKHPVQLYYQISQTLIGKWSLTSHHGTAEGVDHPASHYPGTLLPSSWCQKLHCSHQSSHREREQRKWHPVMMHDLVLASVPLTGQSQLTYVGKRTTMRCDYRIYDNGILVSTQHILTFGLLKFKSWRRNSEQPITYSQTALAWKFHIYLFLEPEERKCWSSWVNIWKRSHVHNISKCLFNLGHGGTVFQHAGTCFVGFFFLRYGHNTLS